MLPPLNRIAAEISVAFHPLKRAAYAVACRPYIEAMLEMTDAKGHYGIDPGEEIILRFLHNATRWKGPQADKIKSQLRQHIYNAKENHASN